MDRLNDLAVQRLQEAARPDPAGDVYPAGRARGGQPVRDRASYGVFPAVVLDGLAVGQATSYYDEMGVRGYYVDELSPATWGTFAGSRSRTAANAYVATYATVAVLGVANVFLPIAPGTIVLCGGAPAGTGGGGGAVALIGQVEPIVGDGTWLEFDPDTGLLEHAGPGPLVYTITDADCVTTRELDAYGHERRWFCSAPPPGHWAGPKA